MTYNQNIFCDIFSQIFGRKYSIHFLNSKKTLRSVEFYQQLIYHSRIAEINMKKISFLDTVSVLKSLNSKLE